jgi:hypothetical protein
LNEENEDDNEKLFDEILKIERDNKDYYPIMIHNLNPFNLI